MKRVARNLAESGDGANNGAHRGYGQRKDVQGADKRCENLRNENARTLLVENGGNKGAKHHGGKELVDCGDDGGDGDVSACIVRCATCYKERNESSKNRHSPNSKGCEEARDKGQGMDRKG